MKKSRERRGNRGKGKEEGEGKDIERRIKKQLKGRKYGGRKEG